MTLASATRRRVKKNGNHSCALAPVISCLSEEDEKGKTKEGKAQGGRGKAHGRKAWDAEGKGEERKEEGKAGGVNGAFS